jgi:hypothetical protein
MSRMVSNIVESILLNISIYYHLQKQLFILAYFLVFKVTFFLEIFNIVLQHTIGLARTR